MEIESFFNYLKKLFGSIFKNILVVSILAGIVFLTLGYTNIILDNGSGWKDLFKILGTTILSSGVFMAIAKSHQFTNIIKNELRDVIYADEHLDKRKDIHNIWLKVSDSLCKQKFAINKDILNTVHENYLPIEEEFYYERFELELNIDFPEGEDEYIECEEITTAEIIVKDPDGYNLEFNSWIPLPSNDNNKTKYELVNLEINGNNMNDPMKSDYMNVSRTKKNLFVQFKRHFKENDQTYIIKRTVKKVYSLETNPYDSHIAAWLYKKFIVKINYPKQLKIDFVEVGVLKQWKTTFKKRRHLNILDAVYNGFVFKNQGFAVIFRKQ